MTPLEPKAAVIRYWRDKAGEALESARSEYGARRYSFAVNRAYYACFYMLSAVLLQEGLKFSKHSGVRAALHRALIKTGRLDPSLGRAYDRIFESRQRGDYQQLVTFEAEHVTLLLEDAERFVATLGKLLPND